MSGASSTVSYSRLFGTLIASCVIAIAGGAFAAGTAQAAAPNPVVTLAQDGPAEVQADGTCVVHFIATWDSSELRGPNVDWRLYESANLVAAGFRVSDTGEAHPTVRDVAPGAHNYEFALVRGGQDRVLTSDSITVTC